MNSHIKCDNCRQSIEKTKYAIHQSFCLKNNKYCPICSLVISTNQYEEHMKNHSRSKEQSEKKRSCNCGRHKSAAEHKEAQVLSIKKEEKTPKQNDIIPAKFNLCEYCANYLEDIEAHLQECEVKKFIEEEDRKYYLNLKERVKSDEKIAGEIDKEEQRNKVDDEKVAKELQLEYERQNPKPKMNDIDLAKKLQEEFDKLNPRLDDAELAKKLQIEYEQLNESEKTKTKATDAELAQELQLEFQSQHSHNATDEELAGKLEKDFNEKDFNEND